MPDIKFELVHLSNIYEKKVPASRSISDFMNELETELKLPLSNSSEKPLHYQLSSKALGRLLLERETFASAGIPVGDRLTLICGVKDDEADQKESSRRISIKSSIGLTLDNLTEVEIGNLLSNEPALMMTLHSYKESLSQIDQYKEELMHSKEQIELLRDQLKERNIATVLFILGQIQIGFGTNLITNNSNGGWFVFILGLALNIGALYFSFFGVRNSKR
jgi:hypothetical protein